MAELKGTELAPEGQIWVCAACGKTSRTKYGFLENGARTDEKGQCVSSYGWDESCMMNSVLCFSQKTEDGTWKAVGA